MHTYSVHHQRFLPLAFAVLSVISAYGFWQVVSLCAVTIPWWFDAPSVLGFYGIYSAVFNRLVWRMPMYRRLAKAAPPDLNGSWTLEAKSSYDEFKTSHQGTAEIVQTGSKMVIRVHMPKSRSRSLQAAFEQIEGTQRFRLVYLYLNEPHADAIETMQAHSGTAELETGPDFTEMVGNYYTGRGRQNYGTLRLVRSTRRTSSLAHA